MPVQTWAATAVLAQALWAHGWHVASSTGPEQKWWEGGQGLAEHHGWRSRTSPGSAEGRGDTVLLRDSGGQEQGPGAPQAPLPGTGAGLSVPQFLCRRPHSHACRGLLGHETYVWPVTCGRRPVPCSGPRRAAHHPEGRCALHPHEAVRRRLWSRQGSASRHRSLRAHPWGPRPARPLGHLRGPPPGHCPLRCRVTP